MAIDVPVPRLVLDDPDAYQLMVPVPLTLKLAVDPLQRVCCAAEVILTGEAAALQIRVIHTLPSPLFIPERLSGLSPAL